MSHQSTAAAGHLGNGDSGTAWEGGPEGTRASLAGAISSAEEGMSSVFGDGQSEAEAQLYAYLDHLTAPRLNSGFQPLQELNARLNEQPYRDSLLFPHSEQERESAKLSASPLNEPYRGDLDWFDHRFGELKRLLTQKDEGKREIAQVNARLAEIIARVDKLSAVMPSGKIMASVGTGLATLSRSLQESREQSAADAGRISRAAKEILAASTRMQEAPVRFEAAARHTVEGLSRTVSATASRAAVLTAAHITAAPKPAAGTSQIERLEAELRALNQQSRESGERTADALNRVHNSLRDFLERGQAGQSVDSAQPPKRRASVHQPISSDSAVYMRGETGFGAAPAPKPRLDTLILRNPPPSDPNFFEALREAGERLGKKAAPAQDAGAARHSPKPPVSSGTSFLREEEKGTPLAGIAAVAFILLLVSAALFYLHTKGSIEPVHLSAASAAKTRTAAPVQPLSSTGLPFRPRSAQVSPSLFSAADQDRSSPQPDNASEDLEMLEAAARHGDRDAQFRIGTRFFNSGSMEDRAKAARWFAKAAGQGHIAAQFMWASMLERGDDIAKDEAKAIALYRQAASAGHVQAMHNLGTLLVKNETAQSYREAASWFYRAAQADCADSQYNLALLYEHGLGIEQDLSRAYQWYIRAAKLGVKEAAEQAGRLKRTLSAAGMAAAADRAGSWQPVLEENAKSADKGSGVKG